MRFLRWYGRLTKDTFNTPNIDDSSSVRVWSRDTAKLFVDRLKWVFTTSLTLGFLMAIFNIIWDSLPEATRNSISYVALVVVDYLSLWASWIVTTASSLWILLSSWAIATWSFLDPIKPFFIWLFSFDPHYIFYVVLSLLLHLVILLFIANLSGILIMPIVHLLKIMLGADQKKKYPVIELMELGTGLFIGYLATTSSFSITLVSYCARFISFH